MFSIGEFARLGQVSVKMLRHYDSLGLLRPARVDPDTGYRFYTAAQLPAVGRIVALRDLGFGLAEIAALADGDVRPSTAYLERERQLRESIETSQSQLRRLTASRTALVDAKLEPVLVKSAPRQLVATSPDRDFAALEQQVAEHGARADGPPMTLIGERVLAAVPVLAVRASLPGALLLPEITELACCRYQGRYDGLAGAWQALLDWVRDVGAEPGGDLREVYLSFSAEPDLKLRGDYLTSSPGDFVTELQVPMTPSGQKP